MDNLNHKINKAISLIWQYSAAANSTENCGYTVCFSGGKDSQVLLDLFKLSGVQFKAVYNVTTIDPPENVRFIKQYYPEVEFVLPKLNFFKLIEKKGFLPTINKRYCCQMLKEYYGKGFIATGVRREESAKRATYDFVSPDIRNKKKTHVRPLLDWTESEIWQYIEEQNLPVNPCYEHTGRVGCMFCPFAGQKANLYSAKTYPKYHKILLKTIERLIENGYLREIKDVTPERAWEWWISKRNAKEFFTQLRLF